MSRTQGIIGTLSPLILVATVHMPNGTSGTVYVGQSIITGLLKCKKTILPVQDASIGIVDPRATWAISVWDTRQPLREEPVGEVVGSGVPLIDDASRVDDEIQKWLRAWG